MNKPKVSIVIPVYNCPPQFLRQCLDSVVGQTLAEIQIICVDDCSTDGSLVILEEYAQKDPRILLIKQKKNTGIAMARNTGATYATGEYLYFMDCDDWLECQAFENLYQFAQERQVEVVLFEGESWYETEELRECFSGSPVYRFSYKNITDEVKSGKEWYLFFQKTNQFSTMIWLQFLKTSFYREKKLSFHPLTGCAGEDLSYSFILFMEASTMACHQKSYYHYRLREGSGSQKGRNYHFLQGFLATSLLVLLKIKEMSATDEELLLYLQYYDTLHKYLAINYAQITGEDPTKVGETLQNLKNLLFQKPLISCPNWQEFAQLRGKEPEFCFFGAGKRGIIMLDLFREQGIAPPLAICDNSPKSWGSELQGIPVISFEEALKRYSNLSIYISNRFYYYEILQQVKEKLPDERIFELYY